MKGMNIYIAPEPTANPASSGLLVSANFIQLPSRTLVDYYKIIKHPVSLKALQKQVRGAKGHAPPKGATLLKSWNAFEEEASYIWRNAREYNEDGSEIVRLADQLEVTHPIT